MGNTNYESQEYIDYIAGFAERRISDEAGTNHAIENNQMNLRELTIYHYITAWRNNNLPIDHEPKSFDQVSQETQEKAYGVASRVYGISINEAKTIFDKVKSIPRAVPSK